MPVLSMQSGFPFKQQLCRPICIQGGAAFIRLDIFHRASTPPSAFFVHMLLVSINAKRIASL